MARKRKETVAEKIERYRRMNESIGDPDGADAGDSDDLFNEITENDDDPSLIGPLLLLRPYTNADYFDEMTQIVEFTEGYEPAVFVSEFAKVAGQLCRTSPRMAERVLARLSGDPFASALLAGLKSVPPADRGALRDALERLKTARADTPKLVANADAVLGKLKTLGSK